MRFLIDHQPVPLEDALAYAFQRRPYAGLVVAESCQRRIAASQGLLAEYMERRIPIYGVTTGFGDSCTNTVDARQSEELQRNLVAYLLCGTGQRMPRMAVRAMCVARLVSLTRGYSGVSLELIEQLRALLEHDLMPNVPCEGSLGASGDLVPLAYLADLVQGNGTVSTPAGDEPTPVVFKRLGLPSYVLKPKEGLALVNGTSSMVGMAMLALAQFKLTNDVSLIGTSWLCLVLGGKADAFGTLVNDKAKAHDGQSQAASRIRELLAAESYTSADTGALQDRRNDQERPIQDRYSLRCAPQVMGPVLDTVAMVGGWLEKELNSVSDNPLFDAGERTMAMGGNFYGGYLGHGMDYFKICLGNLADLLDRQVMLLFDPKTCAGLPPNLANWGGMRPEERHLHHGLKGLHQVTNALTSEICSLSMPTSVFSRSSECHNQDKVSLGMSAAMACAQVQEKMLTVCALHLACLAQALDLKGLELKGDASRQLYATVRRHVPFAARDMALGEQIAGLAGALKGLALASV